MLDPDTAPPNELNRELAPLQRQYRVASHEVGERDVRSDDIDEATLAWWVAAHRAMWRRRFELSEAAATPNPVDQVEHPQDPAARATPPTRPRRWSIRSGVRRCPGRAPSSTGRLALGNQA